MPENIILKKVFKTDLQITDNANTLITFFLYCIWFVSGSRNTKFNEHLLLIKRTITYYNKRKID